MSSLSTEDPLVETTRRKMRSFHDAGSEAYYDQQTLRASELYGKALALAESIDDTRAVVKYRFWQGTGLREAGHLRQALAVLAPSLQERAATGDDSDVYATLAMWIEIAQNLPSSLVATNKAIAQTESFLQRTNHLDWRHILLNQHSYLYQQRGMLREALGKAQEAWTLWKDEYPFYTADTHLDQLATISLALRDLPLVRRYLTEWERNHNNLVPKERECRSACRQSDLARQEKHSAKAVDWARRAGYVAEQVDHVDNRFAAFCTLGRAFLCNGESERARESLGRLVAFRHSENSHHRYGTRLLFGEFHLAQAREVAGMAPVDDEYDTEFPVPNHIANPVTTRESLACARRAYARALTVGQKIDELLECTLRQRTIAERLARITAIEQRL